MIPQQNLETITAVSKDDDDEQDVDNFVYFPWYAKHFNIYNILIITINILLMRDIYPQRAIGRWKAVMLHHLKNSSTEDSRIGTKQ